MYYLIAKCDNNKYFLLGQYSKNRDVKERKEQFDQSKYLLKVKGTIILKEDNIKKFGEIGWESNVLLKD